MDEFSLVDKPVAEPDIDGIEATDHFESCEPHFLVNFSQSTVAITFPLPNVAFGECPFSVRVLHHGEVYHPVDTLKDKASSRDLDSMTLFLSLTSS